MMTGNSTELACVVSRIKKVRHEKLRMIYKNVSQYRKETCYKKIVEYWSTWTNTETWKMSSTDLIKTGVKSGAPGG